LAVQPKDGRAVVVGWQDSRSGGVPTGKFGVARYHVFTCRGFAATRIGSVTGERIVGTSGSDVIVGLGGDDTILGMDGDDSLCGGPQDDQLFGGPGNDRLYGGWGDDVLNGEAGTDTCEGDEHKTGDTASTCESTSEVP
jgi:Ca2+-binding RTX toxin-like protein